jgi:hypothetical protein
VRLVEVRCQVTLELLHDLRLGLLTPEPVAERRLDDFLLENGAVLERDGQGVGNGALLGVMVVLGELRVFHAGDLLAQRLDELRGGGFAAVAVVFGDQAVESEHGGDHVLHAVVAIGEVVHGLELLVDDADAGLVGAVDDVRDVVGALAHGGELLVEVLGGFDGGLRVELGGVGDFEEHVLHHVGAVGALEVELLAVEVDVVEAPGGSGEHGGHAALAGHDFQAEVDGALAGVTGGPGLAGHGVGAVAVGTHGLSVHPGLRDGIAGLSLGQAEHLRDDSGRSDLDVDNVVKTDLVEAVLERQAALDFVGLDHSLQNILDGESSAVGDLLAASLVGAVHPVCYCEDGAQVVGRVAPLGCQPAVVEVQPADHGSDIECTADGIELVGCAEDFGTVGHGSAFNDWAEKLGAVRELESFETAAKSVEEDETGGVDLRKSVSIRLIL